MGYPFQSDKLPFHCQWKERRGRLQLKGPIGSNFPKTLALTAMKQKLASNSIFPTSHCRAPTTRFLTHLKGFLSMNDLCKYVHRSVRTLWKPKLQQTSNVRFRSNKRPTIQHRPSSISKRSGDSETAMRYFSESATEHSFFLTL